MGSRLACYTLQNRILFTLHSLQRFGSCLVKLIGPIPCVGPGTAQMHISFGFRERHLGHYAECSHAFYLTSTSFPHFAEK